MKGFEELEVWNMSRELCNEVWQIMLYTTLAKDFELRNQMNSASGSVMDNIAEGYEGNGNREFIQFLSISKASCGELRSQLCRCLDRRHISQKQFDAIYNMTLTLGKKLCAFKSYLKKSERKGSKYD
ncbi:MAG: four helix bundle protein [Allomuricauda sp.]